MSMTLIPGIDAYFGIGQAKKNETRSWIEEKQDMAGL